jgi:hypothetical protein
MKSTSNSLERKIEAVKRQLAEINELRVGTLSKQFNVCGSPTCRCKADPPQKHGPYFKLSFTRKGKSSSRFVKEEELDLVESQLGSYKRLRALVDEWIDLGTQLADQRLKQHRQELDQE